jgi:nucleoside-diphosphate-sugar epimerase
MTILVTGGDGRIGQKLVKHLLNSGEKVRMFMHSHKKIRKHKNLEICYGTILDEKSLEKCMSGVDTVYHLAAIIDPKIPKKIMREVNVDGTKNILEAAKGKRIIFMSSTAVMGKKLAKIPADEKTYCKPTNIYGQTKKDAESLAKKAGAIIIRSSAVYGPKFEEGYFDIFDIILKEKFYILGDGKNKIQQVHVSDLVDALILAKDNGIPGEIYLISGGDIKTQEELIDIVVKHLKFKFKKRYMIMDVAKLLARATSIKHKVTKKTESLFFESLDVLGSNRVFNISKAREELGYQPKISYDDGIKEVVDIYKKKRKLK